MIFEATLLIIAESIRDYAQSHMADEAEQVSRFVDWESMQPLSLDDIIVEAITEWGGVRCYWDNGGELSWIGGKRLCWVEGEEFIRWIRRTHRHLFAGEQKGGGAPAA